MKVKKKDYGLYIMYYLLDDEGIGKSLRRLDIEQCKKLKPLFEQTEWSVDLIDYVKRDIHTFLNWCLRNDYYSVLEKLLNNNALPAQEVDKAIEKTIKGEKYEAQVMLMNYKQRIGGYNYEPKVEDRFKL
jgi:hypothetical protein